MMAGEEATNSSVEETVRQAIGLRRQLEVEYETDGKAAGPRTFSPHVLFRIRNGPLYIDGVQTAGASTSGSLPGWRQFSLENVVKAVLLAEVFDLDPEYDPSSPRYASGIIAGAS
jgi:hypothetical protein